MIKRALLFMLWPEAVWNDLRARPQPPLALMRSIVLPLSIVIGLSVQLGISALNFDWSPRWGHHPAPLFGAATAVGAFLASLAAPVVLALMLTWLAPRCGPRRDFVASFNIAVFGSLPLLFAASLLFFMPALLLCMVAFFYSCVQYVLGARIVLQMETDDSAQFVVGALLFAGAAMLMIAIGAGAALV